MVVKMIIGIEEAGVEFCVGEKVASVKLGV